MLMILQVFFLATLIRGHVMATNPLLYAVLWMLFVFVFSLFGTASFFAILFISFVHFLLAFGYFQLLEYLDNSSWWWLLMPFGAVVLILL